MSTYLYLECLDHDPPLGSDSEVGQHLYDLPRIRDEIANRATFVAASDLHPDYPDRYTNASAMFFVQHPHCTIGIRDGYGHEHPLAAEADQ